MMDDSLNAYAKMGVGRSLVEFADANDINVEWLSANVDVQLTGSVLDNSRDGMSLLNGDRLPLGEPSSPDLPDEMIVHLRGVGNEGAGKEVSINLALLLAMATAFCRQRQQNAEAVHKFIKERRERKERENALFASQAGAQG